MNRADQYAGFSPLTQAYIVKQNALRRLQHACKPMGKDVDASERISAARKAYATACRNYEQMQRENSA